MEHLHGMKATAITGSSLNVLQTRNVAWLATVSPVAGGHSAVAGGLYCCCFCLCLLLLPCVCELSFLGCNSFPYLDHCGDLVCGDRQQSFSSSAVHSCAALVPLAVCSRRRRHCQRRAVHSITIICLCRESSLSWFTVLCLVQLVWQQRSLLLAATDWISNCSIFGCRFVAISSAGAASEKRNYVIPAINCMFLRHPPAPTCSGDHHVCGSSNRSSSIPSEDRALRRVIKKAPKNVALICECCQFFIPCAGIFWWVYALCYQVIQYVWCTKL